MNLKELDDKIKSDREQLRKKESCDLKGALALNKRCPKCTLPPPCKHYSSSDKFFTGRTQLFKQDEWILMS